MRMEDEEVGRSLDIFKLPAAWPCASHRLFREGDTSAETWRLLGRDFQGSNTTRG